MKKLAVIMCMTLTMTTIPVYAGQGAKKEREKTEDANDILVAYYSASGNTKAVAEKIADDTDAELFELKPVEEYTEEDLDYNDDESRVCKEHDDPELRDIELEETTVEDWNDIRYVFIGYPIWWGSAASRIWCIPDYR